MKTGNDTFDIVIAGAGPTGLLLAVEAAVAGASVCVVERLLEVDQTIKAGAVGALASEALERRGFTGALDAQERLLVDAFLANVRAAAAHQGDAEPDLASVQARVRKIGGHFAGLFLIDQSRQREPDRRFRGVQQYVLERILAERALSLGVEIRRGTEVRGFVDEGDSVSIVIGKETLRARYLVGCDGGRSFVRKHAGFEFPGTDPTLTGHQAMVELDHPEKLLPLGWRRTPVGMMAFGPAPGRVFVVEFDGPPADRDKPITVDEVQAALRRVSGTDVTITAMKTATRFTDNARQATSYRRGRVFLAGDAAHVHSPFGGQGLNLGLMDAVNLGWKLGAVLQGWATDALLDTYTTERHPVAARVLANTRAQVALMRPDALTGALRDIVADVMQTDEGNRFFGEMMSGIRTRYDLGDPHPLVGTLAANRPFFREDPDETLYDAMERGGGLLLDAGDGKAAAIAERWAARVSVVRAPWESSLLLRPDAAIAWAREASSVEGLEPALERWFGAPS